MHDQITVDDDFINKIKQNSSFVDDEVKSSKTKKKKSKVKS